MTQSESPETKMTAEKATDAKVQTVRLVALNLNPRDLSIALVMLKEHALADPQLAARYQIHLHQWMKDYTRLQEAGLVEGLDLDALVEELDPENTDVFGFSTYIWNHEFMVALATKLKARNPNAEMLFGGSQAGGYGTKLLQEVPAADYVLKGEAEYSFRQFLHARLEGDVEEVPNLFYRKDGVVRSTLPKDAKAAKKMSYLPSIRDLPMPFRSAEYRAYLDNLDEPVTAQFETERGCPLSCAFCSWGTRLPIRRRSQADVEEGLTYLLEHPNVRAVYVVDANPFIKNEKGLWLSEFLLNKNKTGKPVFFELNPEYVKDPRVIENLGRLQGDEMAFGVQSTSDATLKRIKRKFNREVYERNVRRLRELNPNANIKFSLILGLPSDTYETFLTSLDFVIGMVPADIYVHDLLILPGSEMYSSPEEFGIRITDTPPHRLVENETFPWDDYNRAKLVGYYAKLVHKVPWLRDELLKLAKDEGVRPVDLYANYVSFLQEKGVDALNGQAVSEVSSEEFDFRSQSFTSKHANVEELKWLFWQFRGSLGRSRQTQDNEKAQVCTAEELSYATA
jgi:radical SAM superfamily enzyme YgiQ (UPF0313 family)